MRSTRARCRGFPGRCQTALLLAGKAKGIYKSADLTYALSIRINAGSTYADGAPVETSGGGWLLRYHQEGADPANRDRMFTNRGLMQCIADRVPVGVLREQGSAGHRSRYQVLGLAVPVAWSGGFFFLESLSPRAMPVTDPITDLLEAAARAEQDQEPAEPGDDYDARKRAVRQIVARQGQPAFRTALLEAYQRRCAVTGCDAVAALEAAHLRPYRGPHSNAVSNGLLRADIHALLDLRLLAPDPETRGMVISKLLAGTQYESLTALRLAEPAAPHQRPSPETLNVTWQHFREAEELRVSLA